MKVVDFGIAKTVESSSETKLGTLKGKVGYMAPEQARGETLDRRADVFSAGAILWELLLEHRMWHGHGELQILTRLAAGDVPSFGKAGPHLDPELILIGARALGPRRDERYATAGEFARDLERYLDELDEPFDTRRIGGLVREAFEEERGRFRDLVHQQLADPTNLPVSLATQSSSSAPTLSPSVSRSRDLVRFARVGTPVLTPSPPPVSVQTGPCLVNDGETVVVQPQRPNGSGWAARALGLVVLLALGVGALYLNERARASPPARRDAARLPTETAAAAAQVRKPEPASACGPNKPLVEISGDIVADATLRCDTSYLLKFTTFVKSGVTLTIEKGTTIYGDTATRGTLVIQPGARLVARGTPDEPIVFTSERTLSGAARPGDWGGVIVLGHAPTNLRGADAKAAPGRIEGITTGGEYGGSNAEDDSGIIEYVRIEWSGTAIAPNNEINGLTLGGVGSRTTLSHIMVRNTADDCYEFFGGTVNGKHLVCLHPGDDGFDWDYGYRGKLQFLVSVSARDATGEANGFEGDNDPNGSANEPRSEPILYNATLCGPGQRPKPSYGMLLRRSTGAAIRNVLVTGFDAGIDVRDRTVPDIRFSVFFANGGADFGALERAHTSEGPLADDDDGLDEDALLRDPASHNSTRNPGIADCLSLAKSGPHPEAAAPSGVAPPDDGFFEANAAFVGAFPCSGRPLGCRALDCLGLDVLRGKVRC